MATQRNELTEKQRSAAAALRSLETGRDQAQAGYADLAARMAAAATAEEQATLAPQLAAAKDAYKGFAARIAAAREAVDLADEALAAEIAKEEAAKAQAGKNGGRLPDGGFQVHDNAEDRPWAAGPSGLGEFCLAVRSAALGQGVDPRLARSAASGLNEALGPEGGFAVPMEYAKGIEKEMFEVGTILSRVDARDITGNAITYNVQRETSRVDGSRQGGVLGYWVDEGEAPDATKPAFAKMEMKLKKVACLGYSTEELEQDAMALGQELANMFNDELTFQVENKIFRGTGAGCPLGFTNAPCLVTVSKETNQAAATIVPANLSKMWARMPPRSKLNAAWLINVDCEPQLDQLALPVGTAGLEPRFVNYGPDGILRIKGRPVIQTEYSETLGTVGDIALVDLSKYRLIRKGGVQQASSLHVRFAQGENTFRAIYRVDGQPVPRAAITPFKGSNTLSPFVVLATRA